MPVTVDFDTADGTATVVDGDYEAASGTVVFAPGETTRSIVVPTNDDAVFEGDETFVVNLSNPSAGAPLGDGQGVATILDDDPPTTPPAILHFSLKSNGSVGGLTVANENIVSFEGSDFSLLFDGSDVGLSGLALDAFDIISDTEILMSFTAAGTVGGIFADDSDILRFTATSLGDNTSGSFSMYFDGSDVGLTKCGEDVDAVSLLDDGRIVVSTTGSFSVPGASGRDEDLIAFTPTSLGTSTSGSWAIYFDGGDVGLGGRSEDVDAVGLDSSGNIYLSTKGNFSGPGRSGAD